MAAIGDELWNFSVLKLKMYTLWDADNLQVLSDLDSDSGSL